MNIHIISSTGKIIFLKFFAISGKKPLALLSIRKRKRMNRQLSIIAELHTRVKKLITLHKAAGEEIARLKAANEKQMQQNHELKERIKQLEETTKILRLAQALGTDAGGDQNTRDLKMKLNQFINEIDRCLTILH
jgi:hypothetical protein